MVQRKERFGQPLVVEDSQHVEVESQDRGPHQRRYRGAHGYVSHDDAEGFKVGRHNELLSFSVYHQDCHILHGIACRCEEIGNGQKRDDALGATPKVLPTHVQQQDSQGPQDCKRIEEHSNHVDYPSGVVGSEVVCRAFCS